MLMSSFQPYWTPCWLLFVKRKYLKTSDFRKPNKCSTVQPEVFLWHGACTLMVNQVLRAGYQWLILSNSYSPLYAVPLTSETILINQSKWAKSISYNVQDCFWSLGIWPACETLPTLHFYVHISPTNEFGKTNCATKIKRKHLYLFVFKKMEL